MKIMNFWLNTILGFGLIPNRLRNWLLNISGAKIEKATIKPSVKFLTPNINIGNGTFINDEVFFQNYSDVNIGNNVFIGGRVFITTVSHEIGNSDKRAGKFISDPVTIEDGVWIGAQSTILKGVTVGKGSVIASGSVVTKSVPQNCLATGVPARVKRYFE